MNISQDEEYFLRLSPTFQQISVLTVEPEMPIGRRYATGGEDRKYPWRNYHLYGQTFEPTEFSFDEILDRVDGKVSHRVRVEDVCKGYEVGNSPDDL